MYRKTSPMYENNLFLNRKRGCIKTLFLSHEDTFYKTTECALNFFHFYWNRLVTNEQYNILWIVLNILIRSAVPIPPQNNECMIIFSALKKRKSNLRCVPIYFMEIYLNLTQIFGKLTSTIIWNQGTLVVSSKHVWSEQ